MNEIVNRVASFSAMLSTMFFPTIALKVGVDVKVILMSPWIFYKYGESQMTYTWWRDNGFRILISTDTLKFLPPANASAASETVAVTGVAAPSAACDTPTCARDPPRNVRPNRFFYRDIH